MSDDTARAVGAGGSTITIAGKECQVKPLTIRDITELQRECLREYRKAYLQTYADMVDSIPNGNAVLEKKLEEVAKWDISDLPTKEVVDPDSIVVTKSIRRLVVASYGDALEVDASKLPERRLKLLIVTGLESGQLDEAAYLAEAKRKPKKMLTSYANWWVTGTVEGMVTMLWQCFRKYGVTKDEVAEAMQTQQSKLIEVSREIERLSSPEVGNG